MAELFGRDGLRIGFLRLTIGASDFSSRHYTYDDMAPGQADPTLARFSIRPARRQVLPLVREARRLNPDLVLMASPWSAPAWMKTSGSLVTGSLRPEAYDAWARYLARYVAEMGRAGAPISLITLQNEPGFEPADYPGMRVEPQARARFIGGFLGPEFARRGLATGILDHDHNWDRPDSPLTVLADPVARSFVRGVAWHCYNGKVSAQETVHAAAPDKDAYFTECSGGDWTKDRASAFGFLMGELMIGATRHWARGVLFWNLALDERHGPHLGGCGDCRGVVTIDSRTGAVTRNVEYDVLGHLSRFVRPGAVRIAAETMQRDLQVVAFRNAEDASLVVLAHNTGVSPLTATITLAGRAVRTTLPPGAASTLVWPAR